MDINLHIGAHRTATTTFQQFLERNRPTLRQAGVEVWTPERTRGGLFAGLIERPGDLAVPTLRRAERSLGLIAIELHLTARVGRAQLVVSEENMIGSIRNNLRQVRLYPAAAERLGRFHGSFGTGVRRIGLSIRSYDTFWASNIAFGLTHGFPMPPPADLDRFVTQPRRWRDVIGDVAAVFPGVELVVWPFERLASQPERQLALLTGNHPLALPLTGAREWTNASPRSDRLRRILSLRGEAAWLDRMAGPDGRWMPFDDAQCHALRAQYRADLLWLAQGAQGLARLIDPAGAVGSDATVRAMPHTGFFPGAEVAQGRNDRMPRGRAMPPVLAAEGWDFGAQGAMA